MATRKKKASPAQLAARARFAAAAKAGTLRKGAKLKKNPVKKSALRTTPARKKNPVKGVRKIATRVVNPAKRTLGGSHVYEVQCRKVLSKGWETWATYLYLPMAKAVARAQADSPSGDKYAWRVLSHKVKTAE